MKTYLLLILSLIFSICTNAQKDKSQITLNITGNNPQDKLTLKSIEHLKTFNETSRAYQEIQQIEKKLTNQGYIDLETKTTFKNNNLIAYISLGKKYKHILLTIPQDNNTKLETYIKETSYAIAGNSIKIETAFAKALLKQLTTIASNNGNPFATFQITNIKKANDQLTGELTLISEKERAITSVIYKGYEKYPKTYLQSLSKKLLLKPYNQELVETINNEISTLRFLNTTRTPEALFKKDSTTIFYYIEKTNQNQFDGFLGFATNNDNTLRLDGYLNLQLLNNFNYGEEISLNYKSDGEDQSQLKIKTALPYLFKTPVGIEASLSIFRKDSTFSTTQTNLQVFYKPNPQHKIAAGYNSTTSDNLLNSITNQNNLNNYKTSSLQLEHTYLKRQKSIFFPITTQSTILIDHGSRIANMTKTPQTKILLNIKKIFNFDAKNSIYVSGIFNNLFSKTYLTNELFRLGGITSIRGFEENSLFANLAAVVNTEYRIQAGNNLFINTVLDGGYIENALDNNNNYLLSVGAGAGIQTKAGILKINIANGKFNNSSFDFSNTKLHLILAVRF